MEAPGWKQGLGTLSWDTPPPAGGQQNELCFSKKLDNAAWVQKRQEANCQLALTSNKPWPKLLWNSTRCSRRTLLQGPENVPWAGERFWGHLCLGEQLGEFDETGV